jgi:ribosomal protein L11 methyltransferase
MGAKQTLGVEIDPHAASNAKEIVENNNVSRNVKILPGGTECITPRGNACGRYDYILANINRNVLLKDLRYYASNSFEGTKLLLSGFYQSDVKQIAKRAKDCGYFLLHQSSNEAWIHLSLEYRGKE